MFGDGRTAVIAGMQDQAAQQVIKRHCIPCAQTACHFIPLKIHGIFAYCYFIFKIPVLKRNICRHNFRCAGRIYLVKKLIPAEYAVISDIEKSCGMDFRIRFESIKLYIRSGKAHIGREHVSHPESAVIMFIFIFRSIIVQLVQNEGAGCCSCPENKDKTNQYRRDHALPFSPFLHHSGTSASAAYISAICRFHASLNLLCQVPGSVLPPWQYW